MTNRRQRRTAAALARHSHHPPIEEKSIDWLHPAENQPKDHSIQQVEQIMGSMNAFGIMVPIVAACDGEIIAGHGRYEALKALGIKKVQVVIADHLTEAQIKAFRLADNKIAEGSTWNEQAVKLELEAILNIDLNFDLNLSGFSTTELDHYFAIGEPGCTEPDPDDEVEGPTEDKPAVSRLGDLFVFGDDTHRLLCGDATNTSDIGRLMGTDTSRIVCEDWPYNVPVINNISGLGKIKHREFVQASGEMSREQFRELLFNGLGALFAHADEGALVYAFMDWRSVSLLISAGEKAGLKLINLIVWNKTNAGMGSLYRSKHELICLFKLDDKPHVNNIQLGATGRYRSNVWDYPGVNSFGRDRMEQLSSHPTVKPVSMIADIMRDTSHRGDIVMDRFCGSGTTLIAAERTGRRARCMELDPLYVDTAIRRFEKVYGIEAIHVETGLTFPELARQRAVEQESPSPIPSDKYTADGVRIRRRNNTRAA